jgi:hypothetical protein
LAKPFSDNEGNRNGGVMCEEVYKMTAEEERLARGSIAYLKEHGVTMEWSWKVNGQPPEDVQDYLAREIDHCFPSSEASLAELVIGLIEIELPPSDGEQPVSAYARRSARSDGK